MYFDGYLPEAKRAVRLERSFRTSAQLRSVFSFYQRDNLPSFDVKGPRTGSLLPAPAFAVPAVLDALLASGVYGPLTAVVPGEADTFCAQRARSLDGTSTIVTSDSDLLVYDLGPGTDVVFFRDVDLDPRRPKKPPPLLVTTYSPAAICGRLGLDVDSGLAAFAFELFMDSHLSVTGLVQRAKQRSAVHACPEEHAEFAAQYAHPSQLVKHVQGCDLSGLDPRVSEVVLQWLLATEAGRRLEGQSGPLNKDVLFFAPPLLDSGTRTSAWETSEGIRSLAFSLLHMAAPRPISSVHEYARMASATSRGSSLGLLTLFELGPALGVLLSLVRRVQAAVEDAAMQWVVLSACYDIQWARDSEKQSVCLEVLCQETPASGVLGRVTWNAVHWLAQIHATMYSLRMLRQIATLIDRSGALDTGQTRLRPQLGELAAMLTTAAPLPAYPAFQSLRDLPARLKAAGALDLLVELGGLPGRIDFRPEPGSKKKSKAKKRKPKNPADTGQTSVSGATANPFAALGGGS